jgi:hypothetical protein
LASPSWDSADHTLAKKLSPSTGVPNSLPSWLAMMTRAVPILKPVRMGSEM